MLCNRIKNFREYNKLDASVLADFLGISTEKYLEYESGKQSPDIDTITRLASCYKVTVDEFYGYTPRLALYSEADTAKDEVPPEILKMSDLSWDEAQLIMHYRTFGAKDTLIQQILQANIENNQ